MTKDLQQMFKDMLPAMNSCQRNWSDEAVLPAHIDLLLQTAYGTPTKQNVNFYHVIAVTDALHRQNLYHIADSEHNDRTTSLNYNTQVLAPLVLVFGIRKDHTEDRLCESERWGNNYRSKAYLNIGIACGSVLTTAHAMGYRTGFCSCFDLDQMNQYLIQHTDHKNFDCAVLMGIGHPRDDLPHNVCVDDQGRTFLRRSYSLQRPPVTRL